MDVVALWESGVWHYQGQEIAVSDVVFALCLEKALAEESTGVQLPILGAHHCVRSVHIHHELPSWT